MENSLQEFNSAKALEEWAFKIKACRNSGLTVREWCANQGIKPQKFYYWQKKLFTELSPQQTTEFAELPMPVATKLSCSKEAIAKISINGFSVEVLNTANRDQLVTLLTALKQC